MERSGDGRRSRRRPENEYHAGPGGPGRRGEKAARRPFERVVLRRFVTVIVTVPSGKLT